MEWKYLEYVMCSSASTLSFYFWTISIWKVGALKRYPLYVINKCYFIKMKKKTYLLSNLNVNLKEKKISPKCYIISPCSLFKMVKSRFHLVFYIYYTFLFKTYAKLGKRNHNWFFCFLCFFSWICFLAVLTSEALHIDLGLEPV